MAEGFLRSTLAAEIFCIFVMLLTTYVACAKPPPEGSCPKITHQMLNNPCSQLELEVVAHDMKFHCGLEVPIETFTGKVSAPKIHMRTANQNKLYGLIMVDPDAPGHKPPKCYLHWICLNIKGNDLLSEKGMNCGSPLVGYTPPTPPRNSGVHRYQLYLFEQKQTISKAKAPTNRAQFDLLKYGNDLGFCGPPVAAFEFKTKSVDF